MDKKLDEPERSLEITTSFYPYFAVTYSMSIVYSQLLTILCVWNLSL